MTEYGPKTEFSRETHATKYRAKDETFVEAMNRIAGALKDDEEHFREVQDILRDMRFLPGGRVQASMGASRVVSPINCFMSGNVLDSCDKGEGHIMQRVTEALSTMRLGGGIGTNFSTLRPRGDLISKLDSPSSGPVSFMEIFDSTGRVVSSSGHRRGAQMGVMQVDHPDIEEFIHAKNNNDKLTAFNMSVLITDEFMMAVKEGKQFDLRFNGRVYKTVDARALWETIMRSTYDYAEPGVIFIDTIQDYNNLSYCERITGTNPCFTGDTEIWTDEGPKTFANLDGQTVRVLSEDLDGKLVFRSMDVFQTSKSSRLVKVTLDDGTEIRCTPEHKFFMKDGSQVEAQDLTEGSRIQSADTYQANSKGYRRICNGTSEAPLEHRLVVGDVPDGYHVHHINGDKADNRWSNLELIEASEHNSMHMRDENNPANTHPERNWLIQQDHSGKNNGRYRHDILTEDLASDRHTGMSYQAIADKWGVSKHMVRKRLGANHKVVSVEVLDYKEAVYCGTVEDTSRFYVVCEEGGVLVHNCGEIPLPPFGACLLGSFNLTKYVDFEQNQFDTNKFIRDIPPMVRALDNVIDRAAIWPLPEQEEEMKAKRRIGIGITGLANALEALGAPYGSREFCKGTEMIMRTLRDTCYRASIDIAREKGPFPKLNRDLFLMSRFAETLPEDIRQDIREHGIRNSHLLAIAPTGTISISADNVSSGLEPVFSHSYDRIVNSFDGQRIEAVEDYAVREWGVYGKTANSLTPDEHLNVLAVCTPYVDQSISKTVNCPKDIPWEDFKNVYMRAWEEGCKGCTTFRLGGKRFALLEATEEEEESASCYIDRETGRRECS